MSCDVMSCHVICHVFQGASYLLDRYAHIFRASSLARSLCLTLAYHLPLLICMYVLITCFSLLIILPTLFLLLILRTKHIERDMTQRDVRADVLSRESDVKKKMRFVSLAIRAGPMLFYLVG